MSYNSSWAKETSSSSQAQPRTCPKELCIRSGPAHGLGFPASPEVLQADVSIWPENTKLIKIPQPSNSTVEWPLHRILKKQSREFRENRHGPLRGHGTPQLASPGLCLPAPKPHPGLVMPYSDPCALEPSVCFCTVN